MKNIKSIKEVTEQFGNYKTLINAVIRRLGYENITDVNNNGASVGFSGFTYYDETVNFYKKYRKYILQLAEDTADLLGLDTITMIKDFKTLGGEFSNEEIAKAIYLLRGENKEIIINAVVWFAVEEVCRWFEDD